MQHSISRSHTLFHPAEIAPFVPPPEMRDLCTRRTALSRANRHINVNVCVLRLLHCLMIRLFNYLRSSNVAKAFYFLDEKGPFSAFPLLYSPRPVPSASHPANFPCYGCWVFSHEFVLSIRPPTQGPFDSFLYLWQTVGDLDNDPRVRRS